MTKYQAIYKPGLILAYKPSKCGHGRVLDSVPIA